MAKILYSFIFLLVIACGKSGSDPGSDSNPGSSSGCGTYNGKSLFKGADGGCYYINSNGNKTYVSRSLCRC